MKALLLNIILITFSITLSYGNPPENNGKKINIFPNPATDYIQLNINNIPEVDHVKIYNGEGSLVDIITTVFAENKINLHSYTPGRYLIVVFSKTGMHKEVFEIAGRSSL